MQQEVVTLASLQPIFWIIGLIFSAILVALPFVVTSINRNVRKITDKVDGYGITLAGTAKDITNLTDMFKSEVAARQTRDVDSREFEKEALRRLTELEMRVHQLENEANIR